MATEAGAAPVLPRAPVIWRLGRVLETIPETPRTKTLVLDVPGWPGHLAGQHVDIRLTAEDGYQAHLQGVADEYATMKRFGTPEELAHFFVFLCSDKATYSTGSTYFVDGGMLKTI